MQHVIKHEPRRTGFPQHRPPFYFLTRYREKRNISNAAVADYFQETDLQTWDRKIIHLEESVLDWHTDKREKYLEFLGISRSEWTTALQRYHDVEPRPYPKNNYTAQLIRGHLKCLQNNRETIAQAPQYAGISLPAVNIGFAYCGGKNLSLGILLDLWSKNQFQTEEYLLLSGGGSPLSGRNQFLGITKSIPHRLQTVANIHFPQTTLAGWVGPILEKIRSAPVSGWSLSQLLSNLGADIPPCQIYQDNTIIGQYDYKTSILSLNLLSPIGIYHRKCKEILPPPQTQSILQLEDEWSDWKIWRQNIQHKSEIILHWEQDLPFAVAQHLVFQLSSF